MQLISVKLYLFISLYDILYWSSCISNKWENWIMLVLTCNTSGVMRQTKCGSGSFHISSISAKSFSISEQHENQGYEILMFLDSKIPHVEKKWQKTKPCRATDSSGRVGFFSLDFRYSTVLASGPVLRWVIATWYIHLRTEQKNALFRIKLSI